MRQLVLIAWKGQGQTENIRTKVQNPFRQLSEDINTYFFKKKNNNNLLNDLFQKGTRMTLVQL